jgi:hypothetical protein
MRRFLLLACLLAISACATAVPPPAAPAAGRDPQEAWAAVLRRFVDEEGRVDFAGLARDRGDLDAYVAWVYRVSPASDPALFPGRPDRLAYHVNAYNALAMHNVLAAGIPETLAGWRKVPFFFLREVQVGGEPMSLHAYENRVIRPLGEERVHFALNCMVRGCPRLPRTPFTAGAIDAELDLETRRFFAEPRNLAVDPDRRAVRVSEILRFYTEDFLAKAPSVVAYVNRHRAGPPIPADYRVEFIPYDWRINDQPDDYGTGVAAAAR